MSKTQKTTTTKRQPLRIRSNVSAGAIPRGAMGFDYGIDIPTRDGVAAGQ